MTSTAWAAIPLVEDLTWLPAADLLTVENGSIEAVESGGRTIWRWKIETGQTSRLAIRADHPLFSQLRYFDRLQLEYRVAGGEINSFDLRALGHVSGPRQYKVHSFRIAVGTTPREAWQRDELDLAVPYWFPWDNPDGEGQEGYFRFEAMSVAPGTVIEIASARLIRGLIYRKPDYELPITWPVATNLADGSVAYTLSFTVLNSSGRPATIRARVASNHGRLGELGRFVVRLDHEQIDVQASQSATFKLTATIREADIAKTPELYSEPLWVTFAPAHEPEASTWWLGRLVRPLSAGVRRQVVLSAADQALIRGKLQTNDAAMRKLVGLDAAVAKADEFLAKQLLTVPESYGHVRNAYPAPWKPGDIMCEAVNSETGERRVGDAIAGAVWREYLGNTGRATYWTGLAYLLTGDEKYARKGIELLRLYARQYGERRWNVLFDVPFFRGAPIQSSTRIGSNSSYGANWDHKGLCELASMIADSPSWTEADRRLVYEGFLLPYVTELAKLPGQISNQTDITNHNLLLLGLAFRDAHMVYLALLRDCGLISRLADIDADGFSSEGRPLNYHGAAANEYMPSLVYLDQSGLGIPYGKERVLAAIRMPYRRAALNGTVPNAGDCGRGQGVGASHLADFLMGIAPEAKWLGDIGGDGTLWAKLARYRSGQAASRDGWRSLLETGPVVFRSTGMAILRSGKTADEQVMATLDYGRNVFHGAMDRNQITLMAFGLVFTHGPGSLYNVGSGGVEKSEDPRLKSFISGALSLTHNVVVADQTNQLPSVGRLIAWSDRPERQVAVSQVDGIYPGVSHTRAMVLQDGLVVLFDRVRSEREHEYDLVYHNFGELRPGEGWTVASLSQPLGRTGNYGNLIDPKELRGSGVVRAEWDLSNQVSRVEGRGETKPPRARLAFWQSRTDDSRIYSAVTGLNNPNTRVVPDAAPTLIQRMRAKDFDRVTVLEPHRGEPRVTAVDAPAPGVATLTLAGGRKIALALDELIRANAVRNP